MVLSTTLPVFSTMARREREAELIFRGQQYARAVSLFQRKYGNALPPNLDVLLNEQFPAQAVQGPDHRRVTSNWWVLAAQNWPKRSIPHRGSNSLVVAGRRSSSSNNNSSNSNDSSSPGAV